MRSVNGRVCKQPCPFRLMQKTIFEEENKWLHKFLTRANQQQLLLIEWDGSSAGTTTKLTSRPTLFIKFRFICRRQRLGCHSAFDDHAAGQVYSVMSYVEIICSGWRLGAVKPVWESVGKMTTNVSTQNCYHLFVAMDTSEKSFITNTFTAVTNSLLAFITVCGNAIVIIVISKHPHTRQLPYNILLCCLAFADFTVGISAQPTLAIYKVMELRKAPFRSYCAARIVQSYFGWLTAGVSLHILCAISVDRYLALRLHMRYTAVVTVARVLKLVVGLWLFCVFLLTVRFVMGESRWIVTMWFVLMANIALISVFYGKVFQIIRRHRRQIQARDQLAQYFHGRGAVEVARHRRSAVTMMYVLGIFISCYLPFFGTIFVESIQGYSTRVRIAYDLSATVVFLSSTLNPFLYFWRVRNIRLKALEMLRKVASLTKHWFPGALMGISIAEHYYTLEVVSSKRNCLPFQIYYAHKKQNSPLALQASVDHSIFVRINYNRLRKLTLWLPSSKLKSAFSQTFKREIYKWCSENW